MLEIVRASVHMCSLERNVWHARKDTSENVDYCFLENFIDSLRVLEY